MQMGEVRKILASPQVNSSLNVRPPGGRCDSCRESRLVPDAAYGGGVYCIPSYVRARSQGGGWDVCSEADPVDGNWLNPRDCRSSMGMADDNNVCAPRSNLIKHILRSSAGNDPVRDSGWREWGREETFPSAGSDRLYGFTSQCLRRQQASGRPAQTSIGVINWHACRYAYLSSFSSGVPE
jgi:hypothetical protein